MTSATGAEDAASVACSLARSLGLDARSARVLQSSANRSLHLEPADVVARVVAQVGRWRVDGGYPDAARDLAVARAALARGAPVARALDPPIGGPHRADGRVVSFWRFEQLITEDHGYDAPVAVGQALRSLHAALADASPELALPVLPVWHDTVTWLTLAPLLSEADRSWLLALHAALSAEIAALDLPKQALHGDAHPGNAWVTPRGVIWSDFEEAGSWPVEWDLACVLSGMPLGRDVAVRRTIVETYGRDPDDPLIAPFLTGRTLMASAWMALTGDYRGRPVTDRLAENLAWLRSTSRPVASFDVVERPTDPPPGP